MLGNPLILFAVAIIPMLVGSIYYGPIFGNAWMNANGFKKEDMEKGNMLVILGLSYVLSILLSFGLSGLAIHQNGLLQLFATHPDFKIEGSEVHKLFQSIMETYGDRHRTFGHGAVHGAIATIILALPLIAINALFERRGAKYIGIHFGYWLITLTLMSGVICQFL